MNSELQYLESMEKALALQLQAIRERRTAILAEEEREKDLEGVPEMLSLSEAIKRSGMSRGVLVKLCNSGEIPHIRVGDSGKKILINYDALQSYMKHGGSYDRTA